MVDNSPSSSHSNSLVDKKNQQGAADQLLSDQYSNDEKEALINKLSMQAKRAVRERTARKEAEKLLEEKSLELYQANQDLHKLTDELKFEVSKKTAHLEKALDEAKSATDLKSQFISTISHEMRTPLNAVIGFVDRIQTCDDIDEPTHDRYISNISNASQQLLGLINDVLDFEKIASGKLEIESRPFNIESKITSIVDTVQVLADKNDVNVGVGIDPALSKSIMGDELRIQQVIYNLLSNAVKFSNNAFVFVQCHWLEGHSDILEVVVADQGIGMTEEQLEKLFTPFTQADGSMARKFGGTGLGLSICKNLVELMGGEIWAYSKHGEGSEFHFTFKTKFSDEVVENDAPDNSVDLSVLDGASILLVDDQMLNQELGKELLEDMGAIVDVAGDGNEAQEFALAKNYDVILMDLQMPECDGFEASEKILAANPEQKIIALTANATIDVKEKCLGIGMCEFLGKPFIAKVLFEKVAQVVQEQITQH